MADGANDAWLLRGCWHPTAPASFHWPLGIEHANTRKRHDMPIQTLVLLSVAGVTALALIAMLSAAFFVIYTSRLMVSRSPSRVRRTPTSASI
jgi:hypothetical protein